MTNRAIDCLIVENVMDWELDKEYGLRYPDEDKESWGNTETWTKSQYERCVRQGIPCELLSRKVSYGFLPSEDIADAWRVVEKLEEEMNVNVGTANAYSKQEGVARKVDKYYCETYNSKSTKITFATTAPMAICLAALKAKGVEVNV